MKDVCDIADREARALSPPVASYPDGIGPAHSPRVVAQKQKMDGILSEMTVKFIIAGSPDSTPHCVCCLCYSGVDFIGTSMPMPAKQFPSSS